MTFLNPTSWSNPVWAGVIFVIALLWMGSGLIGESSHSPANQVDKKAAPQRVVTQVITPKTVPLPRLFSGVTQAMQSISLPAQTQGQVRSFKVEEGSQVTQGTVIAELDPSTRENALKSAQAAELKAQHDLKVANGLLQKGLGSAAAVEVAKAALAEAENEVAWAQKDLEYTYLRAPFSGVFEKRLLDTGAYASMGDGLATLVQIDPLKVVFSVSESEIGGVEPGQKALLHFPNLDENSKTEGVVTRVGMVAVGQTRTFEVVISVPNNQGKLKAGLSVSGVIQTEERPLLEIPIQAIVLATDGEPVVRIVEGGKVKEKKFPILSLTDTSVWVPGSETPIEVIIQGQGLVSEGSEVTSVKPQAQAPSSANAPLPSQ